MHRRGIGPRRRACSDIRNYMVERAANMLTAHSNARDIEDPRTRPRQRLNNHLMYANVTRCNFDGNVNRFNFGEEMMMPNCMRNFIEQTQTRSEELQFLFKK